MNTNRFIIDEVIEEWEALIKSNQSEHIYHAFIKKNSNLFLANSFESFFSISKLKLGSDYELDFAVPTEGYSKGLQWNLIEIEKPSDSPFTSNGNPSAALTHATQQIRNWKNWLRNHQSLAKRLFSVWNIKTKYQEPNFRFTVIIGTRQNSEKWLAERNQYALENNIEVRSFDYLTDCLRNKFYLDKVMLMNGDWDNHNDDLRERLANPFAQSLNDSDWKEIISDKNICGPHFTSHAAHLIVSNWSLNTDLQNKFVNQNSCADSAHEVD